MKIDKSVKAAMLAQLREVMEERLQRGPEDEWTPEDSLFCEFQDDWKRELATQMLLQNSLGEQRIAITGDRAYRAVTPAYSELMAHDIVTYVVYLFRYWGAAIPQVMDVFRFAATLVGLQPDQGGARIIREIVKELADSEAETLNKMALRDAISYYVSCIPAELATEDDFVDYLNDDLGFDSFHQQEMVSGRLFDPLLLVAPGDPH